MAAPCTMSRCYRVVARLVGLLLMCSTVTLSKQCHLSPDFKNVVHVDLPWDVNEQAGRAFRFYCHLVKDKIVLHNGSSLQLTASNLRFKRLDRGDPFLDTASPFVFKVSERTIVYLKLHAELNDSGPYACLAEVNAVKYPGCITSVRIHDNT